ncbi:MFS transporter [Salinicola sp. CR57]|uniref:MFS transporter n=1 Tax=Salinicola sp. CR57 TaxID=1949086 RepID=UPI000DA17EDD|nr:MFS transporter [Salinicola sp. CR57]
MVDCKNPLWVYVALATGAFAIGVTEFGTMSVLPEIARGLQISEPMAGHTISAYALGVLIGAPTITVLFSRVSRKPLLIGLMLLLALGNGLSAIAPDFYWMLVFRFISGLPHGAYFGMASLVAASVAKPGRQTEAVGYMFMGLTVATIIGVPGATWLASLIGWRWDYAVVTVIGLVTAVLVFVYVPLQKPDRDASPLRELGALKRPNVWLTVAMGAIGYGGLFSVYTYLTATLDQVTHVSEAVAPLVVAVFGLGMTVGNIIVPRFADRAQMPTVGVTFAWTAIALAVFPWAAGNIWTISIDVFCIGVVMAMTAILQKRLMDVAGDAQNLAAALNHVAINAANALGPLLAGMALTAGYGLGSTGIVGAGLTLGGMVIWAIAWAYDKRQEQQPTAKPSTNLKPAAR